ncbi:O-antigen ligase family protein [Marinobacter sp.]|uniref:O-antigen ligase family protein n=1 Tax=Marinobacter sp. TaxID=50741 RepID=UPI002355E844|nr:O-antigen ligase family protein [Marinobacter sp.]
MLLFSFRSFLEVLIAYPFSNKLTVTPAFGNIRAFANLAVVLIPLSWLVLVNNPRVETKVLAWSVNLFWVWVLVLTEARSGLLSLGVGILWVAFKYGRPGRAAFVVFLSVLFTSLLIYIFVPVLSVDGWTRDVTSSSGRWELWSWSWVYFFDSFPFGIGGMMFAADGRLAHASPHNLLLTLMAEWGALVLVGGALFLVVLVKAFRSELSGRSVSVRVRIPVVWAVIAGVVNAQFSGAHIGSFSSIALILAFGAYFAVRIPASMSELPNKLKSNRLLLIVLVCLWAHASFLGYQLYGFSEESRASCAKESSGTLYPRVWVQGRLDCGGSGFGH